MTRNSEGYRGQGVRYPMLNICIHGNHVTDTLAFSGILIFAISAQDTIDDVIYNRLVRQDPEAGVIGNCSI